MSRKHPPMWGSNCPTCGGARTVSVRRGGIARVMSNRYPYTPSEYQRLRKIDAKWRDAYRATFAYHDEDGVYHEPDTIGTRLVWAAWQAEKAAEVPAEDLSRRSIRVYWPTRRLPKMTLALCPDSFHDHEWWQRDEWIRREREAAETPSSTKPRLSFTGSGSQRRADAAERRKAKARRHKERQAKR